MGEFEGNMRELFELLDQHPPCQVTVRVEHDADGVTRGYDAAGTLTFAMPTEDYRGARAWLEHEQ